MKTPPRHPSPGRWTATCSSRRHALERRVLDCFASCFSPRALAYRSIHGRAPVKDAGVIVQRMIDSRVSGVLFTANPTTGDPTEIVVSAAIGVGEGVVADRAEADTFFVDAATLTLRRRVVAHKRSRVAFDATQGSGTAVVDVPRPTSAVSALDEAQLASLGAAGRGGRSRSSARRRTSNGRSTPSAGFICCRRGRSPRWSRGSRRSSTTRTSSRAIRASRCR